METEETHAFTAPDQRNRFEKILDRIFPVQWCELPPAPPEFQGVTQVETCTHLTFGDRIRVLFSGKMVTTSKIVTEHTSGKSMAATVSSASWRHAYHCPKRNPVQ